MIAFLTIIYTSIVVVLFKFKLLKPRPWPIACCVLAGVLILGGIVITWFQCAPMTSRVVTSQYVIQLVPYVKGQVLKVHAQANEPVKKGNLLLEINPENYQYTVNQVTAQLAAAKDNVKQAQANLEAAQANVQKAKAGVTQAQAGVDEARAALVSAQAALTRAKAEDNLARTEERIALDLRKEDPGAISDLKVAKAVQNRAAKDAAVKQAEAGVGQAAAALQQADAGLAGAQSALQQAQAAERQSGFALQVAQSNVPAVEAQLDNAQLAPASGATWARLPRTWRGGWQISSGATPPAAAAAPSGATTTTFRPTRTGGITFRFMNTSTETTAPASAPAIRPAGRPWSPHSSSNMEGSMAARETAPGRSHPVGATGCRHTVNDNKRS
jgi:multidrug resistance efflux pump